MLESELQSLIESITEKSASPNLLNSKQRKKEHLKNYMIPCLASLIPTEA
jgi:hypothetical protein